MFPVAVAQQHAEFIAAHAVAVTVARIGLLDARGDLGKADIAFHVAISVVDLLEVVHVEDDEHLAAAAHLRRAIEIAVLIQKARERVELVPHLAAIDEIQHRKQRDAQPCHVQLRQRDLDDRLRRQKDDERIEQYAAAILKLPRRNDRGHGKVGERGEIHHDIERKIRSARIDIILADGKHHPAWEQRGEEEQIYDLAAHRRFEFAADDRLLIQRVHKARRHRGRQAETEVVRQNIQTAQMHRRTVNQNRDDLEDRDHADERKGEEKAALLLSVERFAQLCEDAHERQHEEVDRR